MFTKLKQKVSGTRRRMEDESVNIDLTYVCYNRIIVMSYPSDGIEGIGFRNHYTDVSIKFHK